MAKLDYGKYIIEVEVPGILDAYPEKVPTRYNWSETWTGVIARIWVEGLSDKGLLSLRERIQVVFAVGGVEDVISDAYVDGKKIVVLFGVRVDGKYHKLLKIIDEFFATVLSCEVCGVFISEPDKKSDVSLCEKCRKEIEVEKENRWVIA